MVTMDDLIREILAEMPDPTDLGFVDLDNQAPAPSNRLKGTRGLSFYKTIYPITAVVYGLYHFRESDLAPIRVSDLNYVTLREVDHFGRALGVDKT